MKKKGNKFTQDDAELTLLCLPTFIWFIVFSFIPMFGIIIAFKNFKVQAGKNFIYNLFTSSWAGLKNFEFLFKSSSAFIMTRNTILYNIVFIILGLIVPVTLAILIQQIYSKKTTKVIQTAMFLPHFMSWVIVSYFVWAFLSYDKGFINSVISSLGGEKVQWYMQAKYWPFIIVFMNLWKTIGYNMVVYLATITGVDTSYYEAAMIDGATKWQQIKFITLPMLKNIVIIMFIMNIGKIFYTDFGLFYQVPRNSNSLYDVTVTLDTFVYRALAGSTNVGMSSAAAFLQSVLGCITILTANAVVKKVDEESALI